MAITRLIKTHAEAEIMWGESRSAVHSSAHDLNAAHSAALEKARRERNRALVEFDARVRAVARTAGSPGDLPAPERLLQEIADLLGVG